MEYSIRQSILNAFGEVVVKGSSRLVKIVNVIIRDNGRTIFVAKYADSPSGDQYLFTREELYFSRGLSAHYES